VWLRIITHRLYVNWGHEKAVGDTAAWLDRHGIPYRDLCFLGAKPEAEADAYIDDAPHNVAELRARGNQVIVFDQPYNRHCAGPRAQTWAEAEDLIMELVAGKSGAYEPQLPGIDAGADRLAARRDASRHEPQHADADCPTLPGRGQHHAGRHQHGRR
jgi:5'-nucleotidase